jgi:hypothetical protein
MSATRSENKTAIYNTNKVQLSCRISLLIKHLIALERKSRGDNASEGEAVESLVLRASGDSMPANKLILQEAAKNPAAAAIINAARRLK